MLVSGPQKILEWLSRMTLMSVVPLLAQPPMMIGELDET